MYALISMISLVAVVTHGAAPDRSALNKRAAEQAAERVARMTLDEKIELVEMKSGAVERMGIPAHHWWNESLHGVARRGKATQFPVPISMASTWNTELIHTVATAISDEVRALHHADTPKAAAGIYHGLTIWSPVVNIARDPRWGRTEETYGEDVLLNKSMGVAFVKGLQGDHPDYLKTVATVKHFVANNTENNRLETIPGVTERALREFYFPAYKAAIDEAGVESFMSAYNGINGTPCSAYRWLLWDVLREEWGFKGTVVTDVLVPKWMFQKHRFTKDGPTAAAAMLKAGVDVYCGGEKVWTKQAIELGLLEESALDRAVTQNLATRIKLGLLRPEKESPYVNIPLDVVGCEKHIELARQTALEGAILLKNEGETLPATKAKYDRIVLAGPYAGTAPLGGYSGTPTRPSVSPVDGFKNIAENSFEIDNVFGGKWAPVPEANLHVPDDPSTRGLKGEYYNESDFEENPVGTRVDSFIHFEWTKPLSHVDPFIPQPDFAVRWTGRLVPNRTGEHLFSIEGEKGARVWLNGEKILDIWDRMAEKKQLSRPIHLEAGKSVSVKIEYYDKVTAWGGSQPDDTLRCKFKWMEPVTKQKKANPKKDLLVYVGGLTHEMAHESRDIMDLRFPAEQLKEIKELAKTYSSMLVVVNGGTAVQLDKLSELAPAVLVQWFPGQEGGNALAELVTGKVNPSGHLPLSIYTNASKLPDFDDYEPRKGRTYAYATNNIAYAFGEGLSYSTFEYSDLDVARDGETIRVALDVHNRGKVDGMDAVQLYVSNLDSLVYQPNLQLKAFKKVSVPAGKTKRVELEFPIQSMAWWDEWKQEFVVDQKRYRIMAGYSSLDIVLEKTIDLGEGK
jgi:beta-glucosidase